MHIYYILNYLIGSSRYLIDESEIHITDLHINSLLYKNFEDGLNESPIFLIIFLNTRILIGHFVLLFIIINDANDVIGAWKGAHEVVDSYYSGEVHSSLTEFDCDSNKDLNKKNFDICGFCFERHLEFGKHKLSHLMFKINSLNVCSELEISENEYLNLDILFEKIKP
ncbi:hypothetical protein BpHYR1_053957 [Brachionus plicatilis]|uniref:Uncharacterized protein n=1 Tax=Brachionus plicatilis TaxID=10195 RepID=A0A3M7PPJ7_BRAPC|nr:hypothetical protein BpHYR1_053957 [Brachionus plicatilis]